MTLSHLRKINLVTATIWLASYALVLKNSHPLFTALLSSSALFAIFILSGASITLVLNKTLRLPENSTLFISLSIIHSILIPPTILSIAYVLVPAHHLANTTIATYALLLLIPYLLKKPLTSPKPSPTIKFLLKHPVSLAMLIVGIVHLFNITRYPFLPALDTYSWVIEYENSFKINQLFEVFSIHRTLFATLQWTIHNLTKLSVFTIFKYIFPMTAILATIPLWMMARNLKSKPAQLLLLLTPLISPTIILEFEITRHNVVFLLLLYFFIGLTYYIARTKNKPLFVLLGIYTIIGSFYHPLFQIISIAWMLSAIIISRNHIKSRPIPYLIILLFGFLGLQHTGTLSLLNSMNKQFATSLSNFLAGNWNLTFPHHYNNADGTNMSWPGLLGAAKFYGFYAGPLVLATYLFTLIKLISSSSRRHFKSLITNKWLITLTLPIIFFLSIGEVFTRFANIAYLPDRAWQVLSILAIPILASALLYLEKLNILSSKKVFTLFILLAISVSGALYINHLTSFTMPEYEITAASWIEENLPTDAMVFSSSSKNLIRYHANRKFGGLLANLYASQSESDIINDLLWQTDSYVPFSSRSKNIADNLTLIKKRSATILNDFKSSQPLTVDTDSNNYYNLRKFVADTKSYINNLDNLVQQSAKEFESTDTTNTALPPLYIFYSKTHPKNPYQNRPYQSSATGINNVTEFPALDNMPDIFEPVYQDGLNVRIWRVNLKDTLHDLSPLPT